MREIKFRGQRFKSKKWVYGNLLSSSYLPDNILECFIITCFGGGKECGIIESFKVIPKTVGQYIGRKDKNKKEIYEGDIVSGNKEVIFGECVFENYFAVNGWTLKDYEENFTQKETSQIEVIGNIYENPELTK